MGKKEKEKEKKKKSKKSLKQKTLEQLTTSPPVATPERVEAFLHEFHLDQPPFTDEHRTMVREHVNNRPEVLTNLADPDNKQITQHVLSEYPELLDWALFAKKNLMGKSVVELIEFVQALELQRILPGFEKRQHQKSTLEKISQGVGKVANKAKIGVFVIRKIKRFFELNNQYSPTPVQQVEAEITHAVEQQTGGQAAAESTTQRDAQRDAALAVDAKAMSDFLDQLFDHLPSSRTLLSYADSFRAFYRSEIKGNPTSTVDEQFVRLLQWIMRQLWEADSLIDDVLAELPQESIPTSELFRDVMEEVRDVWSSRQDIVQFIVQTATDSDIMLKLAKLIEKQMEITRLKNKYWQAEEKWDTQSAELGKQYTRLMRDVKFEWSDKEKKVDKKLYACLRKHLGGRLPHDSDQVMGEEADMCRDKVRESSTATRLLEKRKQAMDRMVEIDAREAEKRLELRTLGCEAGVFGGKTMNACVNVVNDPFFTRASERNHRVMQILKDDPFTTYKKVQQQLNKKDKKDTTSQTESSQTESSEAL